MEPIGFRCFRSGFGGTDRVLANIDGGDTIGVRSVPLEPVRNPIDIIETRSEPPEPDRVHRYSIGSIGCYRFSLFLTWESCF